MRRILNKLWDAIRRLLRAGATPEKLALACAIGVVLGTFPVLGITTVLCFAIAAVFRINIIVLQLVNYAVYPVQLLLILPFIKAGTYLFNVNPLPYSLDQLVTVFQTDFWKTLQEVGVALGLGVAVWAIVSIATFYGVYMSTLSLFRKWSQSNQRELKSE